MNEQQRELALKEWLVSQEFYELCQSYRHAKDWSHGGMQTASEAFDELRREIRKHAAPVTSADALDAKRYRWMAGHYEEIAEWPDSAYANQDAFDAAIDAAMQEKRHD